ncbi:MAG: DUF1566 domain-containing protein [Deltaproteobacteria bacterium]|nr:DUF1566 domain-containing protein [Deltaproteobacteria bacterium]
MVKISALWVVMAACLFFWSGLSCHAEEMKQDGRFVAKGDGTVLDGKNKLMWAVQDNGGDIAWEEAKSYCEKFRAGGYADWRLPTLAELETILDPASEKRFKTFEPITLSGCCPWTSDTRQNRAKTIFFMMGEMNSFVKTTTSSMRALPVRNAP